LLAGSALTFGVATLSAGVFPCAVTSCTLVAGGAAWIATLSTLNAAMQLSLPAWVRARGLAAYLLAFMGSQAVASFAWGLLAAHTSVSTALVVSAAALALTALSVRVLPLHSQTLHLEHLFPAATPVRQSDL
jgi:hypothetical protein